MEEKTGGVMHREHDLGNNARQHRDISGSDIQSRTEFSTLSFNFCQNLQHFLQQVPVLLPLFLIDGVGLQYQQTHQDEEHRHGGD